MSISKFVIHPITDLFPLMDGQSYQDFKADIQAHGLIDSVVIHEGQIVDGRNRLRVCNELGIEPRYVEWRDAYNGAGSLADWIFSQNIHRRHLTDDQRLMIIAGRKRLELEQQAKQRQVEGGEQYHKGSPKVPQDSAEPLSSKGDGDIRVQLAKEANQSRYRAQQALEIDRTDPDLAKQARDGKVKLLDAHKKVRAQKPAKSRKMPQFKIKSRTKIARDPREPKTPRMEELILKLAKMPQPVSAKQIVAAGSSRFITDVARYIPWVDLQVVRHDSGPRTMKGFGGKELFSFTIDYDLYELCNRRKQHRDVPLASDGLAYPRAIQKMLDELRARRKANNDERERTRWNPHTVNADEQRKLLNFIEEALSNLLKSPPAGENQSETINQTSSELVN